MHSALFVPEIKTNLLLFVKVCVRGYTVTFKQEWAIIRNSKCNTVLIAGRNDLGGDYHNGYNENFASKSIDSAVNKFADVNKWHCRMSHLNLKDLVASNDKGNITGGGI